jgi:hypothetical protein
MSRRFNPAEVMQLRRCNIPQVRAADWEMDYFKELARSGKLEKFTLLRLVFLDVILIAGILIALLAYPFIKRKVD